ncbi:tyrosine-type recombinase/integrase [Sinorhizobium saheli]|uniref:tyrosine-type recombinase/integrase n=1 Tax=Sinorhizobium saheli TaxID=36856 RepID=UPI001F3B95A2|nr:tyrosine-type recombinase/integrase [Sinorhizobium saheli]
MPVEILLSLNSGGRAGAHLLRHSLATRLVGQRRPINEVADLLGHRSINTTALYVKVAASQLARRQRRPAQVKCVGGRRPLFPEASLRAIFAELGNGAVPRKKTRHRFRPAPDAASRRRETDRNASSSSDRAAPSSRGSSNALVLSGD